MKTILITGCSSGYGQKTARHFLEQGWQVIATMRKPDPSALPDSKLLKVMPLDVTNPDSIARLAAECGPIDVLVNNAGIGLFGAFEATPMSTIREIFDTNTFGVMSVIQAFLPQFRAQKSGIIINVTSSSTLVPMPLVAAYTASKTATEGFSTSLAHELAAFNIKVKLVQPGYGPTTNFASNCEARIRQLISDPYGSFAQSVLEMYTQVTSHTTEQDVADTVWQAVQDQSEQIKFPAGPDALTLAARH